MKSFIKYKIRSFILRLFPELKQWITQKDDLLFYASNSYESKISDKSVLYKPAKFIQSELGDYSYLAPGVKVFKTRIGKFCSIGPGFVCGYGIHPVDGISTSPMFYSTKKQNGFSLTNKDKIEENKEVCIGNDVFIGMNVTVLDGITIGDGAIIGAGALVSKDIPAYAIAVGNPISIIKYRFNDEQIEKLLKIKWWDFAEQDLQVIEKHFFDVNVFISQYKGI